MKRKILTSLMAVTAVPVWAHDGHAELPGPAGHDLAHLFYVLATAAILLCGVLCYKAWQAARKEE